MCLYVFSISPAHAPPSITPKQHPSHGQQLYFNLAALGETTVHQHTNHQLHSALQPSRNHQCLLGLLSHQVRNWIELLKLNNIYNGYLKTCHSSS